VSQTRYRQSRRGISLIELLVVIGTVSVITTLAVTTIFFLLRAEGNGVKSLANSISMSRLSTDFRRDVHSSTGVELTTRENAQKDLQLELAEDNYVIYRIGNREVFRLRYGSLPVADLKPMAIETYHLAPGTIIFEVTADPERSSKWVSLIFSRQMETKARNETARLPTRNYQIRAVLGHDRRYETTKNENSK
jgi:hypothetical protein